MASDSRAGLQIPAARSRIPMGDRDPTRPESPSDWVELFRRRCTEPELAYCFVGSLPAGTPFQLAPGPPAAG